MNAKLAACWVLTVALAAGGGALWGRSQRPEGSPAVSGQRIGGESGHASQTASEELQALRQEISRLRAGQASSASSQLPSSTPAAPTVAVSPREVEKLAAQARTALDAKDLKAFSESYFTLLEVGEPGYAGLMTLIPAYLKAMGDPNFLEIPANQEFVQEFYAGVRVRAPRLGGLLDALLARPGEPDKMTEYATQLWQSGAKSGLPRERQIQILVTMLRCASEADQNRRLGNVWTVSEILGRLKASEALPEMEKLVLEGSQQVSYTVCHSIARMPAPDALASFRRLLDKTTQDPQGRRAVLDPLYFMKDAGPLLWELAEKSEDAQERAAVLQGLGYRPENLERILDRIQSPGLAEQDRQSLLQGMISGARQNSAVKEAAWKLYESSPALQDTLLQKMASQGDGRAKGIVSEQLRSGALSEGMAENLYSLSQNDRKWARENAESFRGLIASASSAPIRSGAFQALFVVDRPGAVQGLMAVFSRLPEKDRVYMACLLGRSKEGREALKGIAAQDPSEGVRKASQDALR